MQQQTSDVSHSDARAAARFLGVWDESSFGVLLEQNDRIVYANAAYAHALGFTRPDALIATPVGKIVSDDDRARLARYTRNRLTGAAAPDVYEFRALRSDGCTFPVRIRAELWQSEGRTFIKSTIVSTGSARTTVGEEDFDALGRTYRSALFSAAHRILGNEDDAEECVQDALLKAWTAKQTFDAARGSMTSWLLAITRSRALDALRRRKLSSDHRAVAEWTGSRSIDPDPIAADHQKLRAFVALLPTPQREAIRLAYFEDLTHSEIAARLGEPLGTVKTRLQLAMKKLRAMAAFPQTT